MAIILAGLLVRFTLVVIDTYFFQLPGGEYDAFSFNRVAVEFSNHLHQGKPYEDFDYKFGWIYSIFIGYVYYFFGASNFLGSCLSCLAWLISALTLRTIMIKLDYKKKYIFIALFIYTFLFPTSIIFTSLMLREAYLLLFSNLLFLSIVYTYNAQNISLKILSLILLVFVSTLLSFFHRAGIIFTVSLSIFLIVFLSYRFWRKIDNLFFYVTIFFVLFLFHYFGILERIFDAITSYQSGHFEVSEHNRALYYQPHEVILREYSIFNFVKVLIENFIYYFTKPTFLSASNIKDIPAIFENNLRIFAIIFLIYKLFFDFKNKNLFIILFAMFFLSEFVYSQATVNWGTATRHHLPSLGFLVLLFFFPKVKEVKSNTRN